MSTTPHSAEGWRAQIDACRKRRDKFVKDVWQTNVAFRVQRPFSELQGDEADDAGVDQISVPADWSRSRSKTTALFSQLPRISLEPGHARYMQSTPQFEKIVNHFVPRAGALSVLEECCADVVNASGVCAAIAKYEATFEDVQVPASVPPFAPPSPLYSGGGMGPAAAPPSLGAPPPSLSPFQQAPDMAPPPTLSLVPPGGQMLTVKRTISERYRWYRISPAQLLWPVDFKGADWQRARWLGYDGMMPWARAKDEFQLTDDEKRDVCVDASPRQNTTLAGDMPADAKLDEEIVRFSEIFYWASLCYPDEKRFEAIRRIVFVTGRDEPVIHEDYQGQKWNEQTGQFLGCTRLPIEVTTLTYISDRAIPPSDSEIGRPQVLEQMRSRSQMIMQRTRNLPIRTFDVNRVPPEIGDLLMRGIWQGMIPTNGPGERVLSQIAAAAFPRDDYTFDQVSNRDLDESWSMSPNQMGALTQNERSASEAQIVAGAYASVIGFQRQKMTGLFLGLVETTMGLLQLTLDNWEAEPIIGQDGVQKLQQWDRSQIAGKYVATIRQDASVLQDSGARVNQLMKFLNITGKSGRINIDPILAELAALSGLDPSQVLLPPQPPKQEPLNISYRFSGWQDLHDPMTVAMLVKTGQAPGPKEMQAAKQMIADSMAPLAPPPMQALPQPPGFPSPMSLPGGPMNAPPPPRPPGLPSLPHKDWAAMERVSKRPDELGG